MSKHEVLNTTLPAELKGKVVKQAFDNGRSIKKELELILNEYFKTKEVKSEEQPK